MAEPLWTREAAVAATGGQAPLPFVATGVSIDTRTLEPGDLFVALADVRDGHDFVAQAMARGAAAALISKPEAAAGPALIVPDTLLALEQLGRAARDRAASRVAITGSVGKTTVKELTAAALAACGATHASVKSYNNHWGVPLTLARTPHNSRFGVFEIGMNHGGEIARLSPQVRPQVAAITMVAPVHIENFANVEGIADSKSEIFLGLAPGGTAVINGDNPHADRCAARAAMCDARVIRYGHGAFDARVLQAAPDGAGQRVAYDVLGTQVALRLAEPGHHWTMNALAALTLAVLAGGDARTCAAALDGFGALEGRGAATSITVPGGAVTLFDEAYNANPASMAAAIATLGGRPVAGRRIAALGDMLELGPDEGRYHAGVAADLDAANIDLVYCAGPRMKHLWDALPTSRKAGYAETAAELAPLVAASVKAGDAVMVKGSNGSRMRLVVEALKALGDGHAL